MKRIDDHFCGYLSLDKDVFTYYISNGVVTLLPAYSDPSEQRNAFERISSRNIDSSEFIYGLTGNTHVAMLRNGKIHTSLLGMDLSAKFATPLIVQAAGNAIGYYERLTEDWGKFHAITFAGGNINAIYNPEMAVIPPNYADLSKSDGAHTIKLRSWSDYTHTTDFEIYGEKVTLTITVLHAENQSISDRIDAYSLGKLNSSIRFSFENAQSLDKIEQYYRMAKSLIAILTRQNNIIFETHLSQRGTDNQFFKSASCKIFDHHENYSLRQWHQTIQLLSIFDYLPNLLKKIAANEIDVLLDILPDDNRKANLISISNVQDMCTALEIAYRWSDAHVEKDALIKELKKNINATIADFIEHHNEIDARRETTISSAFQYLDYTLKVKIHTLYTENRDIIDPITAKHNLPTITEDSIGEFVKLRNNKTHQGVIDWGDSAKIYHPLFALLYSCLLKSIGVSGDKVKMIVQNIF